MQSTKLKLFSCAVRKNRDINVRCPGESDSDGDSCRVSPFLFTSTQVSRQVEHQHLVSEEVEEFYRKHGGSNQLVEVRFGINIANKVGAMEKRGCSACVPYRLVRGYAHMWERDMKQPKTNKFVIMEVSHDVFVDAEHDPYDVGCLFFWYPELSKDMHNPPKMVDTSTPYTLRTWSWARILTR